MTCGFHYSDLITDIYITYRTFQYALDNRPGILKRSFLMIYALLYERVE